MPTFTIPGTTPRTAEVTMRKDGNDVHIAINDVDIVFLNGEDGELCLFTLDDGERTKLESVGIALDSDRRHVKIWKA
jgi:hypothetical protein